MLIETVNITYIFVTMVFISEVKLRTLFIQFQAGPTKHIARCCSWW